MSAVEGDEHTELAKNTDIGDNQHTTDDATFNQTNENIPSYENIHSQHTTEEHVPAEHSTESAAIELSKDTQGEVITNEHKEEAFAVDVDSAIPHDIHQAHENLFEFASQSAHDDSQVEQHTAVVQIHENGNEKGGVEAAFESDASKIVGASFPTEEKISITHEAAKEVKESDDFPVAPVSYEVSSQPFYHGGAPIVVSQNTLEVCEAEPELAASPLAPYGELAAHDEAVGAIAEDIPAVVEESNSQVDSSVAQKQLVTEELEEHVEEGNAVVEARAPEDTNEDEHVVSEEIVKEESAGESASVEPSATGDLSNHSSTEPTTHEDESAHSPLVNAEPVKSEELQSSDEPVTAVTEAPALELQEKAAEVSRAPEPHLGSYAFSMDEVATPINERVPIGGVPLVLLSSNSEICIADPQEPQSREAEEPIVTEDLTPSNGAVEVSSSTEDLAAPELVTDAKDVTVQPDVVKAEAQEEGEAAVVAEGAAGVTREEVSHVAVDEHDLSREGHVSTAVDIESNAEAQVQGEAAVDVEEKVPQVADAHVEQEFLADTAELKHEDTPEHVDAEHEEAAREAETEHVPIEQEVSEAFPAETVEVPETPNVTVEETNSVPVAASADIEPPSIDAVSEPVKEAELVAEQKDFSVESTDAHAAVEAATVDEAREVKIEASEIPIVASTDPEHDEPEKAIEVTPVLSQEEIAATSETDAHEEAKFSQEEEPVHTQTSAVEETATPVIAISGESLEDASVEAETSSGAPEPEADRPKSPWTPSYAVTNQGPGTEDVPDDSNELAELEQLPTADAHRPDSEVAPVNENPVEAPADGSVSSEDVHKTWPVSYSVSSQGPGIAQAAEDIEGTAAEAEAEAVEEVSTATLTEEVSVEEPIPKIVEPENQPATIESEVEVKEEIQESPAIVTTDESDVAIGDVQANAEAAPERPWTPSYSVSQQGASPLQTPKELESDPFDAASQETTPAVVAEEQQISESVEQPRRSWTPSYSVSRTGASPSAELKELDIPAVEATVVPAILTPDEVNVPSSVQSQPETDAAPEPRDIPERPWTPSYTVSRLDSSPRIVQNDLEESSPVEQSNEVPVVATPTEEAVPARPWTPSYSVSRQGSTPLIETKNLDEAAPATESPQDHVEIAAPAPERPWTPSYSVSRQGTTSPAPPALEESVPGEVPPVVLVSDEANVPQQQSSADVSASGNEASSGDAVPERPWTPSYSVSRQGSSPRVVAAELPEPVNTETSETAQSPWTPSYSVSVQGNSPLAGTRELPQVDEPLTKPPTITVEPSTITIGDAEATTASEVPSEDAAASKWTPSYSVSQQGASPLASPVLEVKELEQPEVKVDASEAAVTEETKRPELEPPTRSWSASYSVTTQGPVSPALGGNAELPTEASNHAFPSTEVSENEPNVISKPTLARLAPVDELEQTDAVTTTGELGLSPNAQRARLESTTSSRFFPGGWFSGNPKTPEENRASLDHAAGEFSKTDNLSVSPALDVPANTPVEGEPTRRHRWCLVM